MSDAKRVQAPDRGGTVLFLDVCSRKCAAELPRRALSLVGAALGALGLGAMPPNAPTHATLVSAQFPHRWSIELDWSGVAPCVRPRSSVSFDRESPSPTLRSAWLRLTNDRRLAAPESVDFGCHDYECAARRRFGYYVGPQILQLAVRYHYLAGAPGGASGLAMNGADLDAVLEAFQDLPANLFPLQRDGWRTLSKRSQLSVAVESSPAHTSFTPVAEAGAGTPGIVLLNGWDRIGPNARRAAIVHELAHEFGRARAPHFHWRAAWTEVMAADQAYAAKWGESDLRVSDYAYTNIDEDFAESVAAYRYLAPALKRRAPHRYDFLREWLFDGLEYGAATKCAPARARSEEIRRATRKVIEGEPSPPASWVANAASECRKDHVPTLCAARRLYQEHYRRSWGSLPARYPAAASNALDALLSETDFVDRALGELSPEARDKLMSAGRAKSLGSSDEP